MENTDTKKFNITILEIYYIIMLIFKLLDYEIVFSNRTIGWICAVIIHLIIVCISFKKINYNNLTRFLALALIQYIFNTIKNINVFEKFILLITNILIYYFRKNNILVSSEKKEIKEIVNKIIVGVLLFFAFINLFGFYFFGLYTDIYTFSETSPNSKYEVYIEETPTGAWSRFTHDIYFKENTFNFGTIKIQRIKHCRTLVSDSKEIIVLWEDNENFTLWETSSDGETKWISYICKYTRDSFINSDEYINALDRKFREEMKKLKTVKGLNYDDNENKEDNLEKEDDDTVLRHYEYHIWIINSKKELLMQSIKHDNGINSNQLYIPVEVYPDENEKKVIKRELKKEINAEIDINKLKYMFTMSKDDVNIDGNALNYRIYLLEMDLDIKSLKSQEKYKLNKIYYKDLEKMATNEVVNLEECKIMLSQMNKYL